ncbi:MAG: SdiA-regulated domain-containing protein [Adhaeribacter sp.]
MKKLQTLWVTMALVTGLCACDASQTDKPGKKNKKDKKEKSQDVASSNVKVLDKWDLPNILQEVSGIAYIDKNRFACVQDESGVIFIYNTNTNKIESDISFGATGDYEGIALADKIAYVVRSDGKIFEVNDITTKSPQVKEYATALTAKNDVEGITYDKKQNRLLVAIKGNETNNTSFKGIYAFDLKSKKLSSNPVIKIDLNDSIFANAKTKKLGSRIQPSEIAVHPESGDIYVLEGSNPQLLILDSGGAIKYRYKIKGPDFPQPEGMSFSPGGELFISNEGKKASGNILKVEIN